MALIEVLLKKPVDGLGAEGDQVKVRAGYARNFLLTQGIAVPVNQANRKQIEALKKARAVREAKELDEAKALAEKISALTLNFTVKSGEGGKLFGSIATTDIVAKIAEQGIEISRKLVHLPHGALKLLGKHKIEIKPHHDVTVEMEVELIPEEVPVEEAPIKKGKKGARPRKVKEEAPAAEETPATPAE